MSETSNDAAKAKRTAGKLALFAVGMFGFAFLMVPFYSVVCKVTGLNGKTNQQAASAATGAVDMSRTIEVIFLATNNEKLDWEFRPTTSKLLLHPGEDKRIAYYAKNNSGQRMTVQAVPSVTPGLASKYIQKTECFCFTQQTFDPGQSEEMPLIFRLDQSIPKKVKTLVLAYTLFDAGKFAGKPPQQIPGHIN